MKFKIVKLLLILPALAILSCQTEKPSDPDAETSEQVSYQGKKNKTEEVQGNILDTFAIPKHKYSKFKKLKTAEDYFQSACDRSIDSPGDSIITLICLREYQETIKLDSTYWWAYRNLSRCFRCIGRDDLAFVSVKRAMKFCPDLDQGCELYEMRGSLLYKKKEYKNAAADFQKLIDLGYSPLDHNYYYLAMCALKSGEKEKAQQIVKEAKAKKVDFLGYNLSVFEL